MRAYRIDRDVAAEAYRLLLAAALEEASTFSLVWRDQLTFAATAGAVRTALRDLQLRHVKRDWWPGTKLIGHYAAIVTYRAAPEALPVLLEPGSLFAWRSPAYPEDLSFSTDRSVCLATVSHDAQGWILSASLAETVRKHITLVPLTLDAEDEEYFRAV